MNEHTGANWMAQRNLSAFLKISYIQIYTRLKFKMDTIKKFLSIKRPHQTPVDRRVTDMTEEMRSEAAAKRQKKQQVSEREYTYQSKVVLHNFVSISHLLDNALVQARECSAPLIILSCPFRQARLAMVTVAP